MRRVSTVFTVTGAAGVVFLLVLLFSGPASAQAPAGLPPGYVGAEVCKHCHEDQFQRFGSTKMGRLFLNGPRDEKERLACETCHGPGKAHAEAGGGKGVGGLITFAKNDKTPVAARNAVCLKCHTKGPRIFWDSSPHAMRDVACTNCHHIMDSRSPHFQLAKSDEIDTCGQCHLQKRAQTMRSSHMPLREAKLTCSSCHNPHGGVTPTLLKENSINETCYTCHAEKRGPFLWEHAPVPESCVTCHDPHGSNHERMLKVAKPRLCQQCHITSGHPTRPFGRETVLTNYKAVLGRQCVNCHTNIHGSNSPSGNFFER